MAEYRFPAAAGVLPSRNSMEDRGLTRLEALVWELPPTGAMRVPALVFGTPADVAAMEEGVLAQLRGVAGLPGIVRAALAMPDAHSGYGFPIGGVAAFDPDQGGVVCAGGVGFDIACGVRALVTDLSREDLTPVRELLADRLFARVPAGLGGGGALRLSGKEMDRMLGGGAAWAVAQGFGEDADLAAIEDGGTMAGADPGAVSDTAKKRQRDEVGTLGSGNHYLEVQYVEDIADPEAAMAYGLVRDRVVISIHCGSRGLGHQTATDYIARMQKEGPKHGLLIKDPELACLPIASATAQAYLGAMRAAGNCALAGRQVITRLVRDVFSELFPGCRLRVLCDVAHNTCRAEPHTVDGRAATLYVHRKGATRAVGPTHPDRPERFPGLGQPILVGGSMGTRSFILSGADAALPLAFASTCHGAGRAASRKQARQRYHSRDILRELAEKGISLRTNNLPGLGEEAPGAYKNIEDVVQTTHALGLATKTARLRPLACIKG
jgi:tRNA-splicing ligase RtcB (3'-phosphate/5'-hydroxy nucleic acid ligase)